MKKLFCLLIVCAAALCTFCLASCGEENGSKPQTSSTASSAGESEKELGAYFSKFVEGDNPLYGTWKIKGMESISYIFRNDDLAEMVMGSEGDFSKLTVDESQKTITVQFVYGLNDAYSYTLSEDGKTLKLTSATGTDAKLTLKKQKDYSLIPEAPAKPAVDDKILGWWQNEEGIVYYFGGDGIMYSNIISFETCYTYKASNGKIDAVYEYGGNMDEKFDYKLKGDTLTLNGSKYKKIERP